MKDVITIEGINSLSGLKDLKFFLKLNDEEIEVFDLRRVFKKEHFQNEFKLVLVSSPEDKKKGIIVNRVFEVKYIKRENLSKVDDINLKDLPVIYFYRK
ncbi:hypothetical protein DRQ09_03595 [candidate division KSB1 bacterium]|nr:MAG: hypothetical protein DRQ09_03595 [candidate division KSB1 bacterium]